MTKLRHAVSLKPSDGRLVPLGEETLRGITMGHYRIYELDPAGHIVDGYSVMCRSDAAALAMASKGAENWAAAVEVWESTRHVARLDSVTPWHRLRRQWTGQSAASPLDPSGTP
jgi:hypothetical protein